MRHHLTYIRPHGNAIVPTGQALFSQIGKLNEALTAGDTLVMQDGQLFAHVVNHLTDFDNNFSQADCQEIIDAGEPPLVTLIRKAHDMEVTGFAYAERTVFQLSDGYVTKQLLVKAFGEPAWINIGNATIVELYSDYKARCH